MKKHQLSKKQFYGVFLMFAIVMLQSIFTLYQMTQAGGTVMSDDSNVFWALMASAALTPVIAVLIGAGIYQMIASMVSVDLNMSYGLNLFYYLVATIIQSVLTLVLPASVTMSTEGTISMIVSTLLIILHISIYSYLQVRDKVLPKEDLFKVGLSILVGQLLLTFGLRYLFSGIY